MNPIDRYVNNCFVAQSEAYITYLVRTNINCFLYRAFLFVVGLLRVISSLRGR
mgnify:FL=1